MEWTAQRWIRTVLCAGLILPCALRAAPPTGIVQALDDVFIAHWQAANLTPRPPADDATFLRRLTLDLLGRIPTVGEARAFAANRAVDKREKLIRSLLASGEFPKHMGLVLDGIMQEKHAGDAAFSGYLAEAIAEDRSWDEVFRQIILAPREGAEEPANRFVLSRVKNLDELTIDTARIFFGVNVSCAKCHDHPLVSDWKQDHFYGMASFFNRTYEFNKEGARFVAEKSDGEVKFVNRDGVEKTATLLFLSGAVVKEPSLTAKAEPDKSPEKSSAKKDSKPAYVPPPFSRRELLIDVALENKTFFSRSLVNHLWAYFLGRGVVEPVDQMHSENPPAVRGVLELLGDDFAAHGYKLNRVIETIVSSRVYQMASAVEDDAKSPNVQEFAVGQVKPLSPRQYAVSLALAAGPLTENAEENARLVHDARGRANTFLAQKSFDAAGENYHTSVSEALYMSNNAEVQKLLQPGGGNLTERLTSLKDDVAMLQSAYWAILSRAPTDDEVDYLATWLAEAGKERSAVVRSLVWALLASAEFRFNH